MKSLLLEFLGVAVVVSLVCGATSVSANTSYSSYQGGSVTTNATATSGDITGQNIVPQGWTVNAGTQGQIVYINQQPYRVVNGQLYQTGAG